MPMPTTTITRAFSTSRAAPQARQKLKPITTHTTKPRRPAFEPNNPYLPTTQLVGTQWRPPIEPHQAPSFPILIPQAALDPSLTKKLGTLSSSPSEEILAVRQIAILGENHLNQVVEDWVRNELNVMGTIREETIQIFMKLVLHPSTLAPLAEKMKLRTAGRRVPIKASQHAPRRIVPASTTADIELTQLFHYLIGSIARSLGSNPGTNGRMKRYILELLTTGLTHTSVRQLLIRASQLSGQAAIGNRIGHATAEIRVAQLDIWGARRDNKIRKLVPDQVPHRTPQRLRKAALLKQRWREEERKMIHWRNRLLKVTAIEENEAIAESMRRQEHALKVKQWNADRKLISSSSSIPKTTSPSTLFSKLFNFWPFASHPSDPPAAKTT